MFNKEESNSSKKVEVKEKKNLRKIGYLLVATSLMLSLSQTNVKADTNDTSFNDYEEAKYKYHERVYEYGKTRTYDELITKLYDKGLVVIDGVTYNLKDFFILYNIDDKEIKFHLICYESDYEDILTGSMEKYDSNAITILKDTTAFIELINSDAVEINDNVITIKDKVKAKEIIDNWDGYLHDKVPVTDAVESKYRLGR